MLGVAGLVGIHFLTFVGISVSAPSDLCVIFGIVVFDALLK